MLTLAGVYKNSFSRVLLVAALATIGSSLGAFVGAPLVIALLG
jgi:pheromone shutdown protein TraB